MLTRSQLTIHLNDVLQISSFKDYCPNGLQIQGKNEISTIVTGVSANLELIEAAIDTGADAIIVHHGFFWKNESPEITHYKHKRIKTLLEHDINLYGYHLPLDAHPTLGNNITLAYKLGITNPTPIPNSLIWKGELRTSTTEFVHTISSALNRVPEVFGTTETIGTIAWCTGGAQNMITDILDLDVDCYLSGEVSEQTPALATENNMLYIAAGHHATERYGVQALGAHLSEQFGISHSFIEIPNTV